MEAEPNHFLNDAFLYNPAKLYVSCFEGKVRVVIGFEEVSVCTYPSGLGLIHRDENTYKIPPVSESKVEEDKRSRVVSA